MSTYTVSLTELAADHISSAAAIGARNFMFD